MLKEIQEVKKIIDPFLLDFLQVEEKKFQDQALSQEAFTKIREFVVSGKTVRGGLFLLAAESFNQNKYQKYKTDLLWLAAALELIHSALLIHDDIIDQDQKRRGLDSIWHQYEKIALKEQYSNPTNFGKSLAICLGSVGLYLANLAIEKVSLLPHLTQQQIRQLINQEIIKTYFAEMLDSKITSQNEVPSLDEVLEMYLFKTARYTFVLPLQLAGLAIGTDASQIEQLIKVGEKLGLIFQIKDDQIGIFSPEEVSGKSQASDIREGKKTIFYLNLIKQANSKDKKIIQDKYGQKQLSKQEIEQIQGFFDQYAMKETNSYLNQLVEETKILIKTVKGKKTTDLLEKILFFNLDRKF